MTILNGLALLLILVLLVRAVGGVVLRVAAYVAVTWAVVGLAFGWRDYATALTLLAVGLPLWLLGHLHYAIKERRYLNRYAGLMLARALPQRLWPAERPAPKPPRRHVSA